MPELSDALHDLFDAEARVQVTPSRGMNALAGQARSARRRGQLRVAALTACGVVILGVGTVVGASALRNDPIQPGGSSAPSPSSSAVAVTWDPDVAVADAAAGWTPPACGSTWSSAGQDVGGVIPVAQASFAEDNTGMGPGIVAEPRFSSDDQEFFLGDPLSYILTKDGQVVANSIEFLNLDIFKEGGLSRSPIFITGVSTCAAQSAEAAIWASAGLDPDADDLTETQIESVTPLFDAWSAQYAELEPGAYDLYVVSPVIFGEQLAVADMLKGQGLSNLGQVPTDLGSTAFRNDPRVSPYCSSLDGDGYCDVPDDVLREVLTFRVEPEAIVDIASGVAISAPVAVTVP